MQGDEGIFERRCLTAAILAAFGRLWLLLVFLPFLQGLAVLGYFSPCLVTSALILPIF